MFTGLVADLGRIVSVDDDGAGARVVIESALAGDIEPGDSIAVNGVCLTATDTDRHSFAAEVMNQTLRATSLQTLESESTVNLELPLRAGDPIGGHIVQGHVDGVGTVSALADDGFARRVTVEAPEELLRYVVAKGSIAVDGVSLTVAELGDSCFTVSLIPETLERTNLGRAVEGQIVNLEVDVLAKYVERLLHR